MAQSKSKSPVRPASLAQAVSLHLDGKLEAALGSEAAGRLDQAEDADLHGILLVHAEPAAQALRDLARQKAGNESHRRGAEFVAGADRCSGTHEKSNTITIVCPILYEIC